MGKYSKVNTSLLRSEANNAISEISSYNISSLSDGIADCDFGGKINILIALNSIQSGGASGSVAKLHEKLNRIISACDEIDRYKKYESDLQALIDDENNGYWADSGKKDILGKIIYYWKHNVHTAEKNSLNNKMSNSEKKIDNLLS